MFKPVTDEELNTYDQETQEMYSLRKNDDRLSYVLAIHPTRTNRRHTLPVIVDGEKNPYMQKLERDRTNF